MKAESWLDKFVLPGRSPHTPSLPFTLRTAIMDRVEIRDRDNDDEWNLDLLPFQLSKAQNVHFEDRPVEEQIAWKLLQQNLIDATTRNKAKRRRNIDEILKWMNGGRRFEYTFSYWCEMLDVDDGYMKRKLTTFLNEWREK